MVLILVSTSIFVKNTKKNVYLLNTWSKGKQAWFNVSSKKVSMEFTGTTHMMCLQRL
ncbi:hypothetical protein HOLleu_36365 [Holothuria leucospilota]|uniref:Uncharacterized protein n=1 Tax=Holothuria leucospilota TaxID=206669 RepID=A0A9Q0YNG5_HOLLE|nr:hypothetical protein HOLleu_36365 [Holothuria leucospilota]